MEPRRAIVLLLFAAVLVVVAAAAVVSGRVSSVVMQRRAGFIFSVLPSRSVESGSSGGISSGLLGGVWTTVGRLLQPWWVRALLVLYVAIFLLLLFSHRAQTYIIYLHWIRPPLALYPPDDLRRMGLAGYARNVEAGNLRGWHLLPSGPPFARCEDDFEKRLAERNARVVIFFHGNSGTRAFPPKRIRILQMLASHLRAHVFSFDYSGFADSTGRPSETQLYADARVVYAFVRAKVARDAKIVVYGQSLGTFAAVDLAAFLSREYGDDSGGGFGYVAPIASVVLEAPPASLMDAAKSHPSVAAFRILPGVNAVFKSILKEELDSLSKIDRIRFPLLILHGREDTFIPLAQGEMLFERAKRANRTAHISVFSDCGHVNVAAQDTYLSTLYEFLERYASWS